MPNETVPLQTGAAPEANEDPNIQPADTPVPSEAEQVDAILGAMLGEEGEGDPAPAPSPDPDPAPAPPAPADPAAPAPTAQVPAPPAAPAAPAPPAPDPNAAKVEAEIAELGIKNERTAARFRELSARAQDADALRARVDELQPAIARLAEWEDRITQTGATPEQFASSMGYLELVNSGDPASMERAFSMIEDEYRNLGRMLGKEVVGGADPLDDHPDLKARVASHDLDRADALRWAEERNKTKIATVSANVRDESTTKARSIQEGVQSIAKLGAELRATDPLFQQKFAMIAPLVNELQKTLPPERWEQGVRDLWSRIPPIAVAAAPAPAAPPAAPKKTTKPLRPGVTSSGQVRSTSDPVDAFLAAAGGNRPV